MPLFKLWISIITKGIINNSYAVCFSQLPLQLRVCHLFKPNYLPFSYSSSHWSLESSGAFTPELWEVTPAVLGSPNSILSSGGCTSTALSPHLSTGINPAPHKATSSQRTRRTHAELRVPQIPSQTFNLKHQRVLYSITLQYSR